MNETQSVNRREHERFALTPMYTTVAVQRIHDFRLDSLDGHAYDVSESGVRIELDAPLERGERVALQLGLPGEEQEVSTSAEVVWRYDDADDPGPCRIALRFREFRCAADRQRLLRHLGESGRRIAA